MITILRFILFFFLAPAFAIVAQAAGTNQDDFCVVDAGFRAESVVLGSLDSETFSYDSSGALLHQRKSIDGEDDLNGYEEFEFIGAAQPLFSFLAEFVAANKIPRNSSRFEIETTDGVTNRRGNTSQLGDVRSRTDSVDQTQVRRVDFDHSHGNLGPGHVQDIHVNPNNPSQINVSKPRAPEPGEYLSPVLSDPRTQGGVFRP